MEIIETHIVPGINQKVRLQEYAVSIFDSVPTRSGIKKAAKKGLILIDGVKASTADWIREGQKIELIREELKHKVFKLKVDVLFEDESIAVIKKPSGFPTSGNSYKNIQNCLPYNLQSSKEKDRLPAPLPVHRLDNPTSGILVCAKTYNSLRDLQKQFAVKTVLKTYTALVQGIFKEQEELDYPIQGKPAITLIRKIANYHIDSSDYSLIEAKPLTGRTHQIRIHLSRSNHSIVGDNLYGFPENGIFKNKSLFLFSSNISFEHPVKKDRMSFKLELPRKFRNLKNLS